MLNLYNNIMKIYPVTGLAQRSLFSGRSYLPLQRVYRGAEYITGTHFFADKYMTLILRTKFKEGKSDTRLIRLFHDTN